MDSEVGNIDQVKQYISGNNAQIVCRGSYRNDYVNPTSELLLDTLW